VAKELEKKMEDRALLSYQVMAGALESLKFKFA
jgi:hypothetical protein